MSHEMIGPRHGYSNAVLATLGRTLYVAGQIGWDSSFAIVSPSFVAQFAQALANVVSVVREAGGHPTDICRLTIYVVDKVEYAAASKEVGAAYRGVMGRHFPAMSLVEVKGLLEPGAKVEIEATAVIS